MEHHKTEINSYSLFERFIHHLAFKMLSMQESLSKLEDKQWRKELSAIPIRKPAFITALPRAGTTLLLELLMNTGEFASHTYKNMPFVFIPVYWSMFSMRFGKSGALRERAHGDGMLINEDSPEAFEEIIWKYFWPSRYKKQHIVPWALSDYPEFGTFLNQHIRKLIFMNIKNKGKAQRYISKNNFNIARIPYLKKLFPDSIVLVPFRNPVQHASSLLKQHQHFSKIHAEDAFAKKYMLDIGHFDFGANLKTISFDNWEKSRRFTDSSSINFWLEYWFHTYSFIMKNYSDEVLLFDYDTFCTDPKKTLTRLADICDLKNSSSLISQSSRVKAPGKHSPPKQTPDPQLTEQCNSLFAQLRAASAMKIAIV